jgi:hypothetical protein
MKANLRLRRALMLAALILGGAASALSAAHAELGESLIESTAGWFELAQHWQHAGPRTLALNGARVVVATGTSEQPLDAMLDHFEALCRRQSGGLRQVASRLFGSSVPMLLDGILVAREAEVGLVACIDFGSAELSAEDLFRRLDQFSAEGDVSALGGLRMVRVQAQGARTFFVTVSNDGPWPLARMFGSDGDCPGEDPRQIPRPTSAQRVLSAWQEGHATSIHTYRVPGTTDEVFATYATQLGTEAWRTMNGDALVSGPAVQAALFTRGQESLVVQAQRDGQDTLISLLTLDPRVHPAKSSQPLR